MLDTALFWDVITILSVMIEWIVLKSILDEISESSKSKLVLIISLLISIIIISLLTIIEFNINFKLFICILLTYIICRFNYKVDQWKSILISLLYWMILIGFDSIGASIVGLINHVNDMNKLLSNNLLRLELIIISKSLLIALIPVIKIIKLKVQISKKDCIHIIIPIVSNIISIIVIFGSILQDSSINFKENMTILIISFVLLISNISLIGITRRVIKDNNLRIDNKIIKEKMDMQYKYYLNLQEHQSKTRELYHDMNNHIICIQNIYGKNDIADKYIEDMNNKIKECNPVFNTNNIIVDVILNEKKSICDFNNIDFLVDVDFAECKFIEMMDICSIFSNMIDNAIEACNKINNPNIERRIKIRGTLVNKFFVIRCENTKINPVILKNDKVITDKSDSFLHGIGINSIKNSVEKYNGNVEIYSNENKFIMSIYIPLINKYTQLEL